MDVDTPNAPASIDDRRNLQVDNALRAMREKKPVPEIDFSIHTMEDGTQVNTLERVCKGSFVPLVNARFRPRMDRSQGGRG